MTSTLQTSYLGQGLLADRPVTPAIDPDAIAFWWSTDAAVGAELSVYANGAWGSAGGGYAIGSPPTLIQFAHKQGSGCNSLTMTAPTNGNLLVALCFNPTSDTANTGWTRQVDVTTGTDFGVILTKAAGAGESTTQSPLTGSPTVGATCIWEFHHASGVPLYGGGASQVQQTGTSSTLVSQGLVQDAVGVSAVALVTGQTISSARNIGTQDVLDNTGDRRIVAGHIDLTDTPNAGIVAKFSGSGSSKSATAIILAP